MRHCGSHCRRPQPIDHGDSAIWHCKRNMDEEERERNTEQCYGGQREKVFSAVQSGENARAVKTDTR